MRPLVITAFAALLVVALAGCVPQTSGPAHPSPIIVREFTYSAASITLDPSFGFSLQRGTPGVPPRERAGGVARAVAFSLADAVATQLGLLGYDAIRSSTVAPEPGARALIISGTFRHINEGRPRHVGAENPSIAVDTEIDYQVEGAAPQRIAELHLDSRQVPPNEVVGVSARRGVDVKAAASRVGGAIARYIGDTARLNNWPTASR
jgi:hypothetical protein